MIEKIAYPGTICKLCHEPLEDDNSSTMCWECMYTIYGEIPQTWRCLG